MSETALREIQVNPRALAQSQGVSVKAAELFVELGCIDLHIDTFIPPRLPLIGYDPLKRQNRPFLGGRLFGHLDIPRILESGLAGAMWSITTNPFRREHKRWAVFQCNFERFQTMVAQTEGRLRLVDSVQSYAKAKAEGAHAVLLAVQGGNAFDGAPDSVSSAIALPGGRGETGWPALTRVTLVHLTNAKLGITSSPFRLWKGKRGLTDAGRELVKRLNRERIFADLAHINTRGFWDAVEVHDKSLPMIATHTGVCGVKRHWRNLDDAQVKAIADSGGVVGIIYAAPFLKRRGGPRDVGMVVEHIEHTMRVGGEYSVAIGTDYDGAIVPPGDLRSGLSYVRLVEALLKRGHTSERIGDLLSGNFLRAFARLRPEGER